MMKQALIKDTFMSDNNNCSYNKLHIDLLKVLRNLYNYSWSNYNETIKNKVDSIRARIDVPEQLVNRILPQIAWWVILQEPIHKKKYTIFEKFMNLNQVNWKNKSSLFHDILSSWKLISPGFYITKSIEECERIGTLVNIVGLKQYTVSVDNHLFKPLKRGELLTGYLFPIGDRIYTSPMDLFHISVNDTPQVTWEVLLHFHQHSISSKKSSDLPLYLALISTALESIEDIH